MSALTYSWHVSNVQCVGSTTRPLPSHSEQVKETRRSLYDSESGVKKMAVGHHLGEHSHSIEHCHNLLSGERVEKQDFVNLEEGGSESFPSSLTCCRSVWCAGPSTSPVHVLFQILLQIYHVCMYIITDISCVHVLCTCVTLCM